MSQLGNVRGYGLGLMALVVALSTVGYFLAGQLLSRPPQQRQRLMPSVVVSITSPKGKVELPVHTRANPRALDLLARKSHQDTLYSFMEPRDHGWIGLGLEKPVSAAFLDSRGTILAIVDIEPCPAPPPGASCRSVAPGVVYRQVLEVAQGWFTEHQIEPGAVVRVRPLEAPPNTP